jgi:hypothetical protein
MEKEKKTKYSLYQSRDDAARKASNKAPTGEASRPDTTSKYELCRLPAQYPKMKLVDFAPLEECPRHPYGKPLALNATYDSLFLCTAGNIRAIYTSPLCRKLRYPG